MNNDSDMMRPEFAAKSISVLLLCWSLMMAASDFRRGSERHVLKSFIFVLGIVAVKASSCDMILLCIKDVNSCVPTFSMSLIVLTTSGGMMSD